MTGPSGSQAVVVRVGTAEYAVLSHHVREVIRLPAITRVPHAPRPICGVAALRGELLPVFDLGAALGGVDTDGGGRVVVVDDPGGGGPVALLVDGVETLLDGSLQTAEPIPMGAAVGAPAESFAGMISRVGAPPVTVLNLESVLAAGRAAAKESR